MNTKKIIREAQSASNFIIPIIMAKQKHIAMTKLAIDKIFAILFHLLKVSLSGKIHTVAKETAPTATETQTTKAFQNSVKSIY